MNHPERAQRPGRRGQPVSAAGLLVQVALATAVAGFVMGLFGASVAGSTGNITAGVLIRGLLALVLVLLITRVSAVRGRRSRVERTELLVLAGAVIGYVLDPLSFVGRSALTQLVTEPGPLTMTGDLLLWTAAAGLGAHWGAREVAGPAPAATPYG